jgi:hypothetical protein
MTKLNDSFFSKLSFNARLSRDNSLSLEPEICAKIRGFINGKCASLLVDTGSTVSIVNDSFIDRRNVSKVSNDS